MFEVQLKTVEKIISLLEKEELIDTKSFIDSVNRGLSDAESGNIYTTATLKEELKKRRILRHSK